ncbi:uncharacterized protein LOC135392303 [Ornithodoros turicata]|uniref:uncharacterized protein LOC135392303 n=1 Tax=Ornithodoros turicata TaxID=34597 RepID=UPI0031399FB8
MSRNCFVPVCETGNSLARKRNKEKGEKNPTLSSVPKVKSYKWKAAIPRLDKELSKTDKVCILHFREDDIERYYTTALRDGTIDKLERSKPVLKKDAVPCLFANTSERKRREGKRRPPTDRPVPEKRQRAASSEPQPSCSHYEDDTPAPSHDDDSLNQASNQDDNSIFEKILSEAAGIEKRNIQWATAVDMQGKFIAFVYVNEELSVTKYMALKENLQPLVFMNQKPVHVPTVVKLQQKVNCLKQKCANLPNERIEAAIDGLPDSQKEAVRQCFSNARRKGPKGRRYTMEWVYECLLMRIKSPALYKHLRSRDLLPLPCVDTLNTYISKSILCLRTAASTIDVCQPYCNQCSENAIESNHLFSPASIRARDPRDRRLLTVLSQTCAHELRFRKLAVGALLRSCIFVSSSRLQIFPGHQTVYGIHEVEEEPCALLVDEMKLTEAVSLDKSSLKLHGFTNLGQYTPDHQKNKKRDHALVFMFQPFRGKWVQALACFLSKGSAPGNVLHKLVLECVLLLERAGLLVDVVTTNGASWNRNMWTHFGVDTSAVSCSHPSDFARRLWFTSDFPHLIKCLRKSLTKKKRFRTPDGPVDIKHWSAIVELDRPKAHTLKACPKLTPDHVNPRPYQKMNVAMAFQFFSDSVSKAMQHYQPHHNSLADCHASVAFVDRVNQLVDTMNARTPLEALPTAPEKLQVLEDFVAYVDQWETTCPNRDLDFMTTQTSDGLKVTLRATLELHEYLTSECGFQYLLTARLNQDALERFFGMMRNACGQNQHPDSSLFVQMFRLLSTYSLVKPPRGSNVTGGEILKSLLDFNSAQDQRHGPTEVQQMLHTFMQHMPDVEVTLATAHTAGHDYAISQSRVDIVAYVAGFVAKKVLNFCSCQECCQKLMTDTLIAGTAS